MTHPHIVKAFDEELNSLTRNVRTMGEFAGTQFADAPARMPGAVPNAKALQFLLKERLQLLDLEVEEPHAFWMHDTCIPLDIAFLASDGTVVGIAENAPPLNDEPRQVACPSRYVLEVPAGWFRRHGAAPGMRIAVTE